MKFVLSALILVGSTNAFAARQDCEAKAIQAATFISQQINGDSRAQTDVETLSNDASAQVVNVTFDEPGGGAHISYDVTVERNPSPIEANQTCDRVIKLELASEE